MRAIHLIVFFLLIAGAWFLFDIFVPYPQIGSLCTDIWLIGRQCVTDPSSALSYPQRVVEWWIQKVILMILAFIVGIFILLMGSGRVSR